MTHFDEYMSIIQNRLDNPLSDDVYGEIHHVVPKSICPILAKSKNNLVRLSAQEHFLAHFYLWRAYRDELKEQQWARKMSYAFSQMKRVITKCEDVEKMSLLYAEVRNEISEAMKGRVVSDETRKKQSEAAKERMNNPEVRKKQSEAMKGENNPMRLYPDKNPMKRPEVKEKLFKKVIQITLDGKLVSEFSSLHQAARETECDKSSISKCCRGKRKSTGGYLWRFSDDK